MEPKRVVVKFGGAAMKDATLADRLFTAFAKLLANKVEVLMVHGGGPEIDATLQKLNIQPKKVNGLRVTDAPTLEVVKMVLAGKLNKDLVACAQKHGINAVGLSALDGKIATASVKNPDLGFVGSISEIDPSCLEILQKQAYLPIVCSVASDERGQHLNVNADELAAAIAAKIKADLFILITDVPGLMSNYPDPSSVLPSLNKIQLDQLIAKDKISSGMIPKVQACIEAIENGAKSSLISDMLYEDVLEFLINSKAPKGTLFQ